MNPVSSAFSALSAIFGAAIMVAPFVRRFRSGSLWLRLGLFTTGLLGIVNSSLGFYLLVHAVHASRFWVLNDLKSNVVGLLLGMLVCLFSSPEFRRLNRPTPHV